DSKADFEPFELDDKYVITRLIAEGGMGKVYAGETKLVRRKIAVKILHPELCARPDMLLRFKMEAEIASSLSHPNIVNVFGSGMVAEGIPYLAMDYVEGESLETLIQKDGRVRTSLCVEIFTQLARALEYTHERGVIHRDLKPSNIMLQPEAEGKLLVKLLDFGIAKSVSVEDTIARELTLPGTVFGSVLYMSPEQILGKKVDFHSDIYSYGCLLYHALTGQPPYQSKNPVDCMQMHVNESIPNLADTLENEQCAGELSKIVNTCLLKDQSQRFESSQQLRLALERVNDEIKEASGIAAAPKANTETETPQQSIARKNDMLAALSIFIIGAIFSAVPFLINLNLAKAESKVPAQKDGKGKGKDESVEQAAAEATAKVDDLLAQTQNAMDNKELDKAEKLGRTAYLTSLTLPSDNPKIAEALFLLGQVFEMQQNYSGANQAYNWALSFNQSKFGPMAPQTIAVKERVKKLQPLLNATADANSPPHIESK
ncbi:MAG: protein kinase, partial [Candidatus Obscuribacterales bacterium]|nr:protein kinase [Candidatus Obscuribacterales bacterium]